MSDNAFFIYPWVYTGPEALWDLRYSLRSIHQHFGGQYQVLLLGDRPPGFGGGIMSTIMPKAQSEHLPRCLDVCLKMTYVLRCPVVPEEFVHIHDDQLLLQDVDMPLLRQRIARNEMVGGRGDVAGSAKNKDMALRTAQALREAGVSRVWNYETHLPRVFEKRKMAEVFERFKPTENRLLYSTLYFNWHWRNQPPQHILSSMDHVKVAFNNRGAADGYSVPRLPSHLPTIHKQEQTYLAMVNKRFLNYNDQGRTPELLEVLKRMFPHPSPFEKRNAPTTTNFLNIPVLNGQA